MSLLHILLQITATATDTVAQTATTPAPPAQEEISLLMLLFKGGYVMIPILLLSVIAIYIFIERFLYISRAGRVDHHFMQTISQRLEQGDVKGAVSFCASYPYPIAKMLEKGLIRLGSSMRDIESAIEHTANVEINKMEKNMSYLAAVAAIAPMLGFLGTVIGMITAFYNMSVTNNISIGIIAGGIYQKMVTSASGLIVGIIAYTLYTILNNKIDRTVSTMETTTTDFLDMLYKPSI